MNTGNANDWLTPPQEAAEDVVSVREAARAVGVTVAVLAAWIAGGQLTAQAASHGRRVSLAAVRALRPPHDPQIPAEALLVSDAARVVGVSRERIMSWTRRGLLPSWQGRHGCLVREADVHALAQQRAVPAAAAGTDPVPPAALLLIGDAARLTGVSRGCLYTWVKKGLVPAWPEPGRGRRVRFADVMAQAEQQRRTRSLRPRREP